MTRIAILSTTKLAAFLGDQPLEAALFAEDELLVAAFGRRGAEAERIPWRRDDVAWRDFDAAVIRSTWDYIDHLDEFLIVLERIEASGCRLINPAATVQWNYDKRYLLALHGAGLPVVPTRVVTAPATGAEIDFAPDDAPDGYVLKPCIGVGAFGTRRLENLAAVRAELAGLAAGGRYMIQPFLPSVQSEGEWSFVFLGGALAYSLLKRPRSGDFRVQLVYGAETAPAEPKAADQAAAERVMAELPVPAHYARIDMARLSGGGLALMESELIEPQLYFPLIPEAADSFADTVLAVLANDGA